MGVSREEAGEPFFGLMPQKPRTEWLARCPHRVHSSCRVVWNPLNGGWAEHFAVEPGEEPERGQVEPSRLGERWELFRQPGTPSMVSLCRLKDDLEYQWAVNLKLSFASEREREGRNGSMMLERCRVDIPLEEPRQLSPLLLSRMTF